MAQDFGDDVGEMLLHTMKRSAIFVGKETWEHFKQKHDLEKENQDSVSTVIETQEPAYACIPFGSSEDTTKFMSMCHANGIEVIGLNDKNENGFLLFHVADYEQVEKQILTFIEENNINVQKMITHISSMKELSETEIVNTLMPVCNEEASVSVENEREVCVNHTQKIADIVHTAQEDCGSIDEFHQILAKQGIGVDTSVKGENLFYEARLAPDGSLLPYDHSQRDWAVTAETLKNKYGVDATHGWFEKKMPNSVDGALDTKGETSDLNQGIESHDGMDTNTSTLRVEREQTGSEVAPSVIRKNMEQATSQRYSLSSEAKASRQASKQLAKERGIEDRVTDISDKFNPMR